MESIVEIFTKLADWIKELVEACKTFAAGFDVDFPNMGDQLK